MKSKYGAVYIQEREVTSNGTEFIVCKLLKDIRFSNIDHKWYDCEGNLSPLWEKYKRRPISVQFSINLQDKNGKEVDFTAKLILPFKLGELKPQDFESCPKFNEEMRDHWKPREMISKDLDNDDLCKTLDNTDIGAFVATLSHGRKISEMKILHACFVPYFILDEYVENLQEHMPFKLANLVGTALSQAMTGSSVDDYEEKLQNQLDNIPEKFSKLLVGIKTFGKVVAEKKEYAEPLIQTYKDFHDWHTFENCNEWKEKQGASSSSAFKAFYEELRMCSIGAYTAVEMPLLDKDIYVPQKVRESLLFKGIVRTFCQHSCLVNDLVSLKKEMVVGTPYNSVFFAHTKEDLTLEDACQKTVDRNGFLTQVMNEAGEMFISMYGEQVKATEVIKTIKGIMYGHIQWIGICDRYLPNTIFDCVVVGLEEIVVSK